MQFQIHKSLDGIKQQDFSNRLGFGFNSRMIPLCLFGYHQLSPVKTTLSTLKPTICNGKGTVVFEMTQVEWKIFYCRMYIYVTDLDGIMNILHHI